MAQPTKRWPSPKTTVTVADDHLRRDAWKSPQTFSTREEHEAAFDMAERMKEWGLPEAKHLVPLMPWPADMIAAYAALGRPSEYPGWALVEVERCDPRTPWRHKDRRRGWSKALPGAGIIIISYMLEKLGSRVRLLSGTDPVVEHRLVHAASGVPVCFDDPLDATRRMDGLIAAEGGRPPQWTWDPPLHDPRPRRWTMERESLLGQPHDMAPIWWRGVRGRWLITSIVGTVRVWRKRQPILDANGQPMTFGSVAAAKRFCEIEDAK